MLDDKYRIDGLVAVGGMGAVYAGTHVSLRKKVAIKVLNPQIATPPMIARFHREAITASQIGHEGIAQVTDLGTSTAGEPFLVMEFLEGESLAKRLKATGPLPVELACELGCAILSPLAAAHQVGIVHRDLKPDNVFLVKQSRGEMIKLLDFGISRAAGLEAELRLTNTGVVMGTPYYMSPEQARGDHEVGPSADLYSFGVILYEMLVGKVPITGENYNQLMYRVMTGEYAPAKTLRPDLPDALANIIARSMALMPEARPASAAELEQALLAFCRPTYREHMIERISNTGIPWGTPPPPSSYPSQSRLDRVGMVGVTQGTDPTMIAPSEIRRARRKWPIAFALAVLIGGGVSAVVVLGQRSAHETAKPAPAAPSVTPVAEPPKTPAPPPVAAPIMPSKVTLRFSVEPADAEIRLDGKVVGTEVEVDRDDAPHKVEIRAAGYKPHGEDIHFDDNQKLVVRLDRVAAPVTHKVKKPTEHDKIESESPYR